MAIDFFQPGCKCEPRQTEFGLCDDKTHPHAYIDKVLKNKEQWGAKVQNPTKKQICFYALDKCVDMASAPGWEPKCCDGVLVIGTNLIFVELKRGRKRWFPIGAEQIADTIRTFKQNYDASKYRICAYVCNSRRPRANTSRANAMAKFLKDTGYVIRDKHLIEIK